MQSQDWDPVMFHKKIKDKDIGHNRTTSSNKLSDESIRLNQLENEDLKLTPIALNLRTIIQQSRTKLQLSQAQLAQELNVKSSIINEYENVKAVPNNQLLGKMERVLSIRLRGKNIGKPLK